MIKDIIKICIISMLACYPLHIKANNSIDPSFKIQEVYRDKDSIRAKLTIVLDDVKLKHQTLLTLIPVLVSEDEDKSFTFPPIHIGGRGALIQYAREAKNKDKDVAPLAVIRRRNGHPQQVEIELAAPYSNWMPQAHIVVNEKTRGCAGCDLNETSYNVTKHLFGEPYVPLYQLTYVEPKAEVNKQREEKFTAHFSFLVSNYTLMRNYRSNNRELDRVDSITNSILGNKDLKVSGLTIDGYASPEGNEKANLDLSRNRAQALVDYLVKKYNLPANMFHVQGHGEDWDGLMQQVANTEMEWKNEVLAIINNYKGQVRKEKIANLHEGLPYRFVLVNFYPLLRRTEYALQYSVKDFSLEEAKKYLHTKPHLLSLNEIYMVANSYPEGSEEREYAFQTAAKIYPQEPECMTNLATLRVSKGIVDNTTERMLKENDHLPQAINTLAVLLAKKGNLQRAKELLSQISNLPEAQNNLREIDKLEASLNRYKN